MKNNFKKKLHVIAKKEGVSGFEIARRSNIKGFTINHYMRVDTANPSIKNVAKIINAFPQYAGYILDLDLENLTKQVNPEE